MDERRKKVEEFKKRLRQQEEPDTRTIRQPIEDSLILDTDSKPGEEKLRLGFEVEGKEVKIRFPPYGKWDLFVDSFYKLLTLFAASAEGLKASGLNNLNMQQFEVWSQVTAIILRTKKAQKMVEYIFFKFLRPSLDNMNSKKLKRWARKNLGTDVIVQMFSCILNCNDYLKKKSISDLKMILQRATQSPSFQQSEKSSDGHLKTSMPLQSSSYVSF